MVTAAKKASASKRTTPKAPATKATAAIPKTPAVKAEGKEESPKAPGEKAPAKVERDMTAYIQAVDEYKALKKGASEHFARISYQARRAVPDEAYAKTSDEAMAKLTSTVAAFREFARLLSEVAPTK